MIGYPFEVVGRPLWLFPVILTLNGGGSSPQPKSIGSILISDVRPLASDEGSVAVDDHITSVGSFFIVASLKASWKLGSLLGMVPTLLWLAVSSSSLTLTATTFPISACLSLSVNRST